MGKVGRGSPRDIAIVCTSTYMGRALRVRRAQKNPNMLGQLHVGWHPGQDQSADEGRRGNVLAATARNGRE